MKTFAESLEVKNPQALKIPATYILTTKDGKGGFEDTARARARSWKVVTLEGGHDPMRD